MRADIGINNFAVYEEGTEFYGMAEAALPEISQMSEEIKGAGISGAFNGAFTGHIEAMTLTLNFRTVTPYAIKLNEPRNHQIELRASKLSPAASAEASGEYAATYFATYINGEKQMEIDILNFIYFINGTDYLAEVRKALGK